jgi:hypothetical protein
VTKRPFLFGSMLIWYLCTLMGEVPNLLIH